MEATPLFRAPKRRKIAHLRHVDEDSEALPPADGGWEPDERVDRNDEDHVSQLVRGRKSFRPARPGLTFSAATRFDSDQPQSTALALANATSDRPGDKLKRFVGSTGQVVDTDNHHMMAYIDSEMAKRRQATPVANTQRINATASTSTNRPESTTQDNTATQPQKHQLSEVDLSCLPAPSNKASSTTSIKRPPRKPRLGRDGKPVRPRLRKRRNSEDLARDALVEQVLHEHRLENVYQPPNPEAAPQNSSAVEPPPDDASRDEVFAERFRQDFLDQIAERKQAQQQKKTAAAGAAVEKTQGPKLGGSRAARARMAATQQHGAGPGGQK